MDIKLGMPVRTSDGAQIGKVDRIVLNPDDGEFLEIIVHQGMILTRDRIVDRAQIADVDLDGTVYLTLTAVEAEELPAFVAHEHIISKGGDRGSVTLPIGTPTMDMPILWRAEADGRRMRHTSNRHYLAAVADAVAVEARSNLPESAVAISRSTEVVDVDGQKLGMVDVVLYNGSGEIKELVVRAGHLHHRELRVPRAWVEVVTHDRVTLNVDLRTVEEANIRWAAQDWSAHPKG